MKKFTLSIALLTISLFTLTACFGSTEEPVATPQATEVNADTLLDNQIYQSAVGQNDAKACAQIKKDLKKDECVMVVEANLLTKQALEKMDADLCDGIEIERYKENCVTQVTTTEEKAKEIEDKNAQLTEQTKTDDKYAVEARKNKDTTTCDKIVDSNIKTACKTSVTIDRATEKKDRKICESLSNPSQIETCKEMVEL